MEHQRVAGVDAAGGLGRAGVVLLTVTGAAAAYRAAAAGDVAFVAFVIVSYSALLLLLRFLRADELAPPEAAVGRERLRRRVWALCMLLSVMFAWKFASVKPWPVAVGVWAAAAATSAGGFVLLFRPQRRLRKLEEGGSGRDAKIKAAVWALITTLLITAMFASYALGVAPLSCSRWASASRRATWHSPTTTPACRGLHGVRVLGISGFRDAHLVLPPSLRRPRSRRRAVRQ
ncbi:unnamed protein product [Miscanthus lutarioriparius]|uniref:Uncharacterized protein n=1 Tax=Miscanthus lutarioriparius TaxID=422564 RepID=A0A811S5K7_9POAL|nr:unnamed protein product [Miscanthus lutarioriparius]